MPLLKFCTSRTSILLLVFIHVSLILWIKEVSEHEAEEQTRLTHIRLSRWSGILGKGFAPVAFLLANRELSWSDTNQVYHQRKLSFGEP